MNKEAFFVTGIGTDVGKTIVSSILCKILKADYWKPIQTGPQDTHDRHFVRSVLDTDDFLIHDEIFKFKDPLSPHIASKNANQSIDFNLINLPITNNKLIIEGAGGLLVPVDWKGNTIIDLIKKLSVSVIVVSRHYLGNINHTLLTIDKLKSVKINIKGIVYVGDELPGTCTIIEQITKVKTLFSVPEFKDLNQKNITEFCKINSSSILKIFT